MLRENDFLTDKQIKTLKEILESELSKLTIKTKDNSNFCLDKNELSDPLDEASINVQASQELRFRNREIFYEKKIYKALDRITQGIYGLCDDCDSEITFERLRARPTAELCINCKEERELTEKGAARRSMSRGKTLSEIGRR